MPVSDGGHLTIVGLGPGDRGTRTLATQAALDAASTVILRTRIHPSLTDLADDPRVSSCDDLYERAGQFDDLYEAIAERVRDLALGAAAGAVVYAVPGHPCFGERSVSRLIRIAAEQGVTVCVLDAVSAVAAASTALGVDPMAIELQLLDGAALAAQLDLAPYAGGLAAFTPLRPLLISQVYNRSVASGVKLALSRVLPDGHRITIVRAAGVPGEERLIACALYELDHHPVDHLTSVWVPALQGLEAVRDPRTFQHVIARLRAPGGCPWDREQTHATLRDQIIDEAYEAVDAIDAGDEENLAEELGDLFLLVAMHAQLAEEAGTFTLEDVYEGITRKIVRRHPHVFGDRAAAAADEVVKTWNEVKAEEKAARGPSQRAKATDGQPHAMPALMRAARVLRKHPYSTTPQRATSSTGDMLLAAVAAVVADGDDPDVTLRDALARHVARQQTPVARSEEKGQT